MLVDIVGNAINSPLFIKKSLTDDLYLTMLEDTIDCFIPVDLETQNNAIRNLIVLLDLNLGSRLTIDSGIEGLAEGE